jgi:hypothetical protein
MSMKLKIDEVAAHVGHVDLFVCSSSFEARCLSLAEQMSAQVRRAIVVEAREFAKAAGPQRERLRQLFEGHLDEVDVSSLSPSDTANVLFREVVRRIQEIGTGRVFIDVTTFTHEHLLILLALIERQPLGCDLQCGYTSAAEYSVNTDEDGVWLSRGIRQVRSVLGYPGELMPSRKLHLIILVGFENDRARGMIEIMEPSILSLGVGQMDKSISAGHYKRNERFWSRLNTFVDTESRSRSVVHRFTFSCVDPFEARDAVLFQSERFPEFNSVVCPMNTKISTIGVGLAAMKLSRLQVVYAAAEEYNELGYSTPSDEARLFSLRLT